MKITTYRNIKQALSEAGQLPYAYLKHMSRIYLGKNPEWISTRELVSARFFGESVEIRVYDDGYGLRAVKFSDEPGDHVIDTWVGVERRFGRRLQKRQYLSFDEDGQARVTCTRLRLWEEDVYSGR